MRDKHKVITIESPGAIFVTADGLRILIDTLDQPSAGIVSEGDILILTQDQGAMNDEYIVSVQGSSERFRCSLAKNRHR